jgi:hypothetical protein
MKVGDLVKLTWFTQSYLGLVMSESSLSMEHFNIFIMENGEEVMRSSGEVKVIAYAGR